MGFFDTLSDLVAAAAPWSAVEAEAVSDATTEAPAQSEAEVKEASTDSAEEAKEEQSEEEPEAEEEEEEEMVDPKEKFEEECKESKECAPAKHHFDECVERVTSASNDSNDKKHPNEDCVEEFFHLAHCASECAAPKLWAALK